MRIRKMRVNHLENPIGYALDRILFSWTAEGLEKKNGVRVLVAEDSAYKNILFDSEYRNDIDSTGYAINLVLKPRTRYYWKVMICGISGEWTEKTAFFFFFKMEEKWDA